MNTMAQAKNQVRQWTLPKADAFHSLRLDEFVSSGLLDDHHVEVELHAAALNYRDLMIAKVRRAIS